MDIWTRRLNNRKQSKMQVVKSMPHKNEGSVGDMKLLGSNLLVKTPGGWVSYAPKSTTTSAEARERVKVNEDGFMQFANGLLVQWGDGVGTNISQGAFDVNFPKEFAEACYTVICIHSTNPVGHGEICSWDKSNTDKTKFRYLAYTANDGAYTDANGPVGWVAIGK